MSVPPKIGKYAAAARLFACPICRAELVPRELSLVCEAGHCFDISRRGYVNFAPAAHAGGDVYDASLFEARRLAARLGAFDALADVTAKLLAAKTHGGYVLDAGCGDGALTKAIARELPSSAFVGADIVRDAIRLAASGPDDGALWCAADITRLPFAGGAFGAVLNILCAANYAEFARVLAPSGLIVKVLPGPLHYIEIYRQNGMDKPPDTQVREQFFARVRDGGELRATARFGPAHPPELLRALIESSPLCRAPGIAASAEEGLTLDWTILWGYMRQ